MRNATSSPGSYKQGNEGLGGATVCSQSYMGRLLMVCLNARALVLLWMTSSRLSLFV